MVSLPITLLPQWRVQRGSSINSFIPQKPSEVRKSLLSQVLRRILGTEVYVCSR